MRVAWSKGSQQEHYLASFVHEVIDMDSGREAGGCVYLIDEEGGYLERYKVNEAGHLYTVIEDGRKVAAWERIPGRFKIIWKACTPDHVTRHDGITKSATHQSQGESTCYESL
jgi:hypothetical protein